MNNAEQLAKLVSLWSLVSEVQLSDAEDTIRWTWTTSGQYTSKFAYATQQVGTFCSFDSMAIWKAKTKGKHCFFCLATDTEETADKLLMRNWPCNPVSLMCDQVFESAEHLCLHCGFAKGVWALIAFWSDGLVQVPDREVTMECGTTHCLVWRWPKKRRKQRSWSMLLGISGKKEIEGSLKE